MRDAAGDGGQGQAAGCGWAAVVKRRQGRALDARGDGRIHGQLGSSRRLGRRRDWGRDDRPATSCLVGPFPSCGSASSRRSRRPVRRVVAGCRDARRPSPRNSVGVRPPPPHRAVGSDPALPSGQRSGAPRGAGRAAPRAPGADAPRHSADDGTGHGRCAPHGRARRPCYALGPHRKHGASDVAVGLCSWRIGAASDAFAAADTYCLCRWVGGGCSVVCCSRWRVRVCSVCACWWVAGGGTVGCCST